MKKLYATPVIPIKTVKDLIDNLYREVGSGKRRKYARPTFFDKHYSQVECAAGRRSFEDLLILARTRFPNTSEKCLMQALKDIEIKFYYCHQIHKAIFHFVGAKFGFTLKKDNFNRLPIAGYADGTYTRDALSAIYKQL